MSTTQCDMMHTVYESDSHESLTNESLKSSVSFNKDNIFDLKIKGGMVNLTLEGS